MEPLVNLAAPEGRDSSQLDDHEANEGATSHPPAAVASALPPTEARLSDDAGCVSSDTGNNGAVSTAPSATLDASLQQPPSLRLHGLHGLIVRSGLAAKPRKCVEKGEGSSKTVDDTVGTSTMFKQTKTCDGSVKAEVEETHRRFEADYEEAEATFCSQNVSSQAKNRMDCFDDLMPFMVGSFYEHSESFADSDRESFRSGYGYDDDDRCSSPRESLELPTSQRSPQLQRDLSEILVGIAEPARMPLPTALAQKQQQ